MPKLFKSELDIYGGKRTLFVKYDDNVTLDQELRIKTRMPIIFKRAVEATNNAFAQGLAFRSAADLEKERPQALPYTRLKDWLNIQRKLIASPTTSCWTEDSLDFIFGSIRKEWRLDQRSETKEYMKRLLGKDHASLLTKLVSKTPDSMAKIFKESLFGVICGLNLQNVYVHVKSMGAVGSSTVSHGNWRMFHNAWDPNSQDIAYNRNRMEMQLVSEVAKSSPISLNIDYISTQDEGGEYENVYGQNMTLEDHILKTFIHEASHMWVAAEDHYYWRPQSGAIQASASLSRKTGVTKGQKIPTHEVETERSVINADTMGWFLYWWGRA